MTERCEGLYAGQLLGDPCKDCQHVAGIHSWPGGVCAACEARDLAVVQVEVARLKLRKGEVLVLHFPETVLADEEVAHIHQIVKPLFPKNQVLVTSGDVEMKVEITGMTVLAESDKPAMVTVHQVNGCERFILATSIDTIGENLVVLRMSEVVIAIFNREQVVSVSFEVE